MGREEDVLAEEYKTVDGITGHAITNKHCKKQESKGKYDR